MSADTIAARLNTNSRRDMSREAILSRLHGEGTPFNKLSPWFRKQLTLEAIKKARETCVCAFNPRPDDDEAETFCDQCIAVVSIVDPKKPACGFAMVVDGKTIEYGPTNQFGERIK